MQQYEYDIMKKSTYNETDQDFSLTYFVSKK